MISAEQIEGRRKAVRLPLDQLATLSGVEQNTVGRIMSGRSGGRVTTLQKLGEALVSEEIRLLRHLAALHPDILPSLTEQHSEAAE